MVASVVTTTSLYPLQARLQHGGQCRVSTSLCLIKVRMQNGDQCFSYHQFISAISMYVAWWSVLLLPPVYIRCTPVGMNAAWWPVVCCHQFISASSMYVAR